MSGRVAKNLLPFLLLTLAVMFSVSKKGPKASEAPVVEDSDPAAASETPEVPSANPLAHGPRGPAPHGGPLPGDAPLTDREQQDMTIRAPIQACAEIGKKINSFTGIPETDRRKLHAQVMCMRQGNVAWMKCIDRSKSLEDVRVCNRRLLP
jgi:hypothetical protein